MITIRPAMINDWESAMALAWRTFQKFEAKEYTQEGVESFLDFISDETLKKMFIKGYYQLFLAVNEFDTIMGMISLREENHISLLFVEEKLHHQGIGSSLIAYASEYVQKSLPVPRLDLTVHAAPTAIPFYEKCGFVPIQEMQEKNGIVYLPMKKEL
ncbi:MAG: GNAT family N-acetyltransferase [Lachnospiraceae bacterium]|nr:GNAT family N-acetyltransferase [Lachnospiraceae bacterium]